MPVYEDKGGSGSTFPILEEHTVVNVEVVTVEEQESFFKDDDGNPKNEVVFKFRITDGEFEGQHLWGRTPTTWSMNEKCKLRQWAEQILATKIPAGTPLDTDDLVGRPARAVVGTFTKKTGEQGNKVTDVMKDKNALPVTSYAENTYQEAF